MSSSRRRSSVEPVECGRSHPMSREEFGIQEVSTAFFYCLQVQRPFARMSLLPCTDVAGLDSKDSKCPKRPPDEDSEESMARASRAWWVRFREMSCGRKMQHHPSWCPLCASPEGFDSVTCFRTSEKSPREQNTHNRVKGRGLGRKSSFKIKTWRLANKLSTIRSKETLH